MNKVNCLRFRIFVLTLTWSYQKIYFLNSFNVTEYSFIDEKLTPWWNSQILLKINRNSVVRLIPSNLKCDWTVLPLVPHYSLEQNRWTPNHCGYFDIRFVLSFALRRQNACICVSQPLFVVNISFVCHPRQFVNILYFGELN